MPPEDSSYPPFLRPDTDRYLDAVQADADTLTDPVSGRLYCIGCIGARVAVPYPAVTVVGGLAVCGTHITAAALATGQVETLQSLRDIIAGG